MLKHLLIPLDGSSLAEAVVPAASELARMAGARVTLLHVVERDAPASVHGQSHLTGAGQAEQYLEKVAASFGPGIEVACHVHSREVRDVAHSLVEHTGEFAPDLVVMCAHGDERLRYWLSGNIPQRVVKRGVTPVLLLKPEPGEHIRFPFQRILAPLDGTPGHEQGMGLAETLARLCASSLLLLTVVPTAGALSGSHAITGSLLPETTRAVLDLAEGQAAEYLGSHVERLTAQGLAASARVARGDPAEVIAATSVEAGIDLVALATHGRAGTEAFWSGSLAQRLIRRIRASFLLSPAQT